MREEHFTLPQIQAELDRLKYNTVTLKDVNGLKIVNQNSPKTTMEQQMQKITAILQSRASPDGPYTLEAKPALKSDQRPIIFHYWKGQKRNGYDDQRPAMSEGRGAHIDKPVLPQEIWNLYGENATLKGDNESLKRQNLVLEARVEHLEEALEDLRAQNQTLSEGATRGAGTMEVLKEAMPHIPAIIQSIQALLKPPAPMAQGPDTKMIGAINQILANQKATADRLQKIEAAMEEQEEEEKEEEEEEEDQLLTPVELYHGLISREFSAEEVESYLREYPHLRKEYEQYAKSKEN